MPPRVLCSPEETAALGGALARAFADRAGLVLYLQGPLGAGKTALARGLLRSLGATGHVRSPTYTLLEAYEAGGRSLIHLDLYRLAEPRELLGLGLGDWPPERHWWLVEWPERAASLLPPADLVVELAHHPDGRSAALDGPLAASLKSLI